MSIRFARLAAVSSKEQAEDDKHSLDTQLTRSLEAGMYRNWVDAVKPYVIPGESRTRWVDLKDAAAAMPDLRRMLEDARARRFDVLVIYDYNRFRDLLASISKTLRHYNVQIFSVNQPLEPIRPEEYNPYKSDTSIQMEGLNEMVSRLQINDLRRKYQEGMPLRASKNGLPVIVPFGYIQSRQAKTPPPQDPELCAHAVKMKDMFLSGQSTRQIAEYMETAGVKPRGKKWYPQTISQILKNPFYAGFVRWGMTKSELDPLSGRKRRNRKIDPDLVSIGPGKHVPLWDEQTYEAIMHEFRQRERSYKGRATQTLTGLLSCGVCHARMWVFYDQHVNPEKMVWRCSSRNEHVAMRNVEAIRLLTTEIINCVAHAINNPEMPAVNAAVDAKRATLIDLHDQMERVNDAYQSGAFSKDELMSRKSKLKDEIADLEKELGTYYDSAQDAQMRAVVLGQLKANLDAVGEFLAEPAQDVNYLLRKVLADIEITEKGELDLTWR